MTKSFAVFEKSPEFEEVIHHFSHSPGKKIRSQLLELVAKETENILDLKSRENSKLIKQKCETACEAVEEIHLASLIHDDFMDDAKNRRGVETLHEKYSSKIAVAAGDHIFASAFEKLMSLKSELVISQTIETFKNMTESQLFESTAKTPLSEKDLIEIAKGKTASLFKLAATLGYVIPHSSQSKIDTSNLEEIQKNAEKFGIQFQIQDDINDHDEDVKNKTQTIPTMFSKEYAKNLLKTYDNPFSKILKNL